LLNSFSHFFVPSRPLSEICWHRVGGARGAIFVVALLQGVRL